VRLDRTTTLRAAFADFIEDKDYQGVRPATLHFYRSNREHFLRDTGIASLDDLTLRISGAGAPHTLSSAL
jgi:hypothetical protein